MPIRQILPATAFACLALAAPGLAQTSGCPSAPAVDGVYIEFQDRLVRHQQLSNGMTAEFEITEDQAFLYEYRTYPVGLLSESWEITEGRVSPGSFETVTLSGAPVPPPHPAPGVTWSGEETSRFADGTVYRFRTSVAVGEVDVLAIGACQYASLPITVARTDLDNGAVTYDALVYLRDLGIVVYLGGGDQITSISYDLPVSIGTRPPVAGAAGQPGQPPRVDTK